MRDGSKLEFCGGAWGFGNDFENLGVGDELGFCFEIGDKEANLI